MFNISSFKENICQHCHHLKWGTQRKIICGYSTGLNLCYWEPFWNPLVWNLAYYTKHNSFTNWILKYWISATGPCYCFSILYLNGLFTTLKRPPNNKSIIQKYPKTNWLYYMLDCCKYFPLKINSFLFLKKCRPSS